jgi:hypothetical protein
VMAKAKNLMEKNNYMKSKTLKELEAQWWRLNGNEL